MAIYVIQRTLYGCIFLFETDRYNVLWFFAYSLHNHVLKISEGAYVKSTLWINESCSHTIKFCAICSESFSLTTRYDYLGGQYSSKWVAIDFVLYISSSIPTSSPVITLSQSLLSKNLKSNTIKSYFTLLPPLCVSPSCQLCAPLHLPMRHQSPLKKWKSGEPVHKSWKAALSRRNLVPLLQQSRERQQVQHFYFM